MYIFVSKYDITQDRSLQFDRDIYVHVYLLEITGTGTSYLTKKMTQKTKWNSAFHSECVSECIASDLFPDPSDLVVPFPGASSVKPRFRVIRDGAETQLPVVSDIALFYDCSGQAKSFVV